MVLPRVDSRIGDLPCRALPCQQCDTVQLPTFDTDRSILRRAALAEPAEQSTQTLLGSFVKRPLRRAGAGQ